MTATMQNTSARSLIESWLAAFATALEQGDAAGAADLFGDECFWRDLIAFTWNLKTAEGRDEIAAMLAATLPTTQPSNWRVAEGEEPTSADGVTEAWIEFETAVGRGKGQLRLLGDGDAAKGWTLLTTLYELKGHEEPKGVTRPKGAEHGAHRNRQTWADRREQEAAELGYSTQPYVLIVGGGQGGIALGARLRQLGVPTIIVDKRSRPGDQWRSRYKSLCLHDPVWYDHLPYIKFPDNWPVFAPKDKIADWLESYAKVMELNYWSNTEAKSAALRRGDAGVDRHGRARGAAGRVAAQAARSRHRDVRQTQPARTSPAWTPSAAISTTRRPIRGRTRTRARSAS